MMSKKKLQNKFVNLYSRFGLLCGVVHGVWTFHFIIIGFTIDNNSNTLAASAKFTRMAGRIWSSFTHRGVQHVERNLNQRRWDQLESATLGLSAMPRLDWLLQIAAKVNARQTVASKLPSSRRKGES